MSTKQFSSGSSTGISWAFLTVLGGMLLLLQATAYSAVPVDMSVHSFEYRFSMLSSPKRYWVQPVPYLDDLEPDTEPAEGTLSENPALSGFATPGEYEPLSFAVYSQQHLHQLRMEATALRSETGTLPVPDIHVIKRLFRRQWYNRQHTDGSYVSRYLLPFETVEMPPRNYLQFWLTLQVPPDAKPGVYTGTVRITPANAPSSEVAIRFEVLPFSLHPVSEKGYAVYYKGPRDPRLSETERQILIGEELKNIRDHGGDHIYMEHWEADLVPVDPLVGDRYYREPWGVEIKKENGVYTGDWGNFHKYYTMLKELGYKGPYIARSGMQRLAQILSQNEGDHWMGYDTKVIESEEFRAAAKRILEGIREINRSGEYPEIVLTHLDEVFNTEERLVRYIGLTKLVHEFAPEMRVYQTFHNDTKPGTRELIDTVAPYVDIRGYHAHTIDEWLGNGHTFEELEQELTADGDDAWCYYNPRATLVTPEWMRLVNGVWLWMSPVKVHCPWSYNWYFGDPLNDADGDDYGFAFPANGDIISTRLWEAYREGVDDMRYLQTLQNLVSERRSDPNLRAICAEAETWLTGLRADLLALPLKPEQSALVKTIAEQFTQKDYDDWRRQCAKWIQQLR
jgi:hypothetical protein